MKPRLECLAVLGTCMVLLTGCAQDAPTASGPTSSESTPVSSATSSPMPTPSTATSSSEPTQPEPSSSTANPSDTTTPDDSSSSIPEASGQPVILPEDRAGQRLTLADFAFVDGDWKDGVYSINGTSVTGIATLLSGCYANDSNKLQLRLGKRFKELTFTVGQGNGGKSVHDQVLVQVLTNGGNPVSKSINAPNPYHFKLSATEVNAVEITFNLDDQVKHCGENGDVQPVIYDIVATK